MNLHRLWSCCLIAWLCLLGHGPAAAANGTHVYLVRGVFNVSVGLDELAAKLNKRGLPATVYGPMSAGSVASDAIADYKAGKVRNIVLVGHSLGGGTVFSVAESLKDEKIPVALMIVLDASGGPAPTNVRRVINYYVGGGMVTSQPGFRGSLSDAEREMRLA